MVYGESAAAFSEWTRNLRAELRRESEEKVARAIAEGFVVPSEDGQA
jgi:hypothetical protein